jgi:hypothetical protein
VPAVLCDGPAGGNAHWLVLLDLDEQLLQAAARIRSTTKQGLVQDTTHRPDINLGVNSWIGVTVGLELLKGKDLLPNTVGFTDGLVWQCELLKGKDLLPNTVGFTDGLVWQWD